MRQVASQFAFAVVLVYAQASWAGGEIVETGALGAAAPHFVCRAGVAGIGGGRMPVTKKATWYFSAVMTGVPSDDVRRALSAFVVEKYGAEVSSSECVSAGDEAGARKLVDETWKAPSMAHYQDYVDTGWVYKPTAGSAASPPVPAGTSKQATFDCDDGSSFVATYYFQPPRRTPVRVTATVAGATTPLVHDRDDANGWDFAASDVSVTVSAATLRRGPQTIRCKLRGVPAGGGVPTLFADAPAPAPDAVAGPSGRPVTAAVPVVAAPPSVATAVYVICRADTSPGEPHFYNPPVNGGDGSYATWQPAYQSYLVEKHHFRGSGVGCGKYPTKAAAQVDFDQWVANARHDSTIPGLSFTVVVTDWTFQ